MNRLKSVTIVFFALSFSLHPSDFAIVALAAAAFRSMIIVVVFVVVVVLFLTNLRHRFPTVSTVDVPNFFLN